MLPWAWGPCSMVPSQAVALLHDRMWKNWQLAAKASPLPVEEQPLQVASDLIALPAAANLCESCLKSDTWETTVALPCPAQSLLLDGGCIQERQPFSRCMSCTTSDRPEQMVLGSTSSPCRKNIFIIRHGVLGVSISAALCLGLLTRSITGEVWFTTFVFIYICVSRKVAICQIWKCLIRSDGQIN